MLLPVAVAVKNVILPSLVGLLFCALKLVIAASVMVTGVVAMAVLMLLLAVTIAVYHPGAVYAWLIRLPLLAEGVLSPKAH